MKKGLNGGEIGARIRALRDSKGLSRKAFGKIVDANPMTIYLIEAKERIPNPELLLKIANFTGTSMEWLLTGKNQGITIRTNDFLREDDIKLLEDYSKLNEKHRYLITESIASYLKAQK